MNEYELLIRKLSLVTDPFQVIELVAEARELLSRLGTGPTVLRIYQVQELSDDSDI